MAIGHDITWCLDSYMVHLRWALRLTLSYVQVKRFAGYMKILVWCSLGRAFESLRWEHASRLEKLECTRRDGRSTFFSLLTAILAVGGRPWSVEVREGAGRARLYTFIKGSN